MIITKKAMSRRTLLRGMGTAVALPFPSLRSTSSRS